MEEIQTRDVEFVKVSDEAGDVYKVICPKCKQDIRIADAGWWNTTCKCGYKWSVDIIATGRKDYVDDQS